MKCAIKTAVPNEQAAGRWGDFSFARCLSAALERRGLRAHVDLRSQEHAEPDDDVVIVLRGRRTLYRPDPSRVNILWHISHPAEVTVEELRLYDHVFVASWLYANALAPLLPVPVETLPQCTDPALFYPDSTDFPSDRILFVGNSRGHYREVVQAAVAQGLRVEVYGAMWENLLPPGYLRGEHIPYSALRLHYASCGVLLNDHWPDMREAGFLSNRLFDAAACAAPIVSDGVRGLSEIFGDAVACYGKIDELSERVRQVLARRADSRNKRLEVADRIRREHTFDARAERIHEVIEQLLLRRPRGAF